MTLVAIDGPAGSGKSTVARAVADRLGLAYLDTGAMYRSVAFAALRRGIDPADVEPVAKLARGVEIVVDRDHVTVDGQDASIEIRGPEVTRAVSSVAANPQVRAELVRRQREWAAAHQGEGVVEGRDIGSVVFPEADVKVYLTASGEARAERRSREVLDLDYDKVAADIARRDYFDSTRSASPLLVADDAIVLDTTGLDIHEVVDAVLARLPAGPSAPTRPDGRPAEAGEGPPGRVTAPPAESAETAQPTPPELARVKLRPDRRRGQVDHHRWQVWMYRFTRVVVAGLCKLVWRATVEGSGNIPAAGAFILSPVHRSNLDTPLVSVMTKRPWLRFMGKDSMFKYRFSDWFFTSMGGFPVHRGLPDREALRTCENLLRSGQPVVVFPEGTRQTGPVVGHLFDGTAYLAAKCQVAIVPVGIAGSERAWPKDAKGIRPVKVHIVVGAPIPPPANTAGGRVPRKAVHELTGLLQTRLQEVFDRAQVRTGA